MKEFINAAFGSESLQKYDTVIRDMAESVERISLNKICEKRDKYANMILNEVGVKDATREDAFAFAHKIITVIDMTLLKNADWIDDTDYE